MLDHKSAPLTAFKEDTGTTGTGTFTGYASTWERDSCDDVIVKGAFAKSLAEQYPDGGAGIPIHWQHKDGSPFDVIGETLSAVEDEHGLLVTVKLDTDIPEGQRAYELLKRGLIHQMSIGFVAKQTAWVEDENAKYSWDGYREIREVQLFEISLVQIAANQGAEVMEVKSGRRTSKADRDTLKDIIGKLSELAGDDDTEDEDEPTPPPPDEDDDEKADPEDQSDESDEDEPDDDKPDQKSWPMEFGYISDFFSLADYKGGTSMNLMEQLAAEKKAAQALIDKGADNLTDTEVQELKQHYAEAKRLQERVDLFRSVDEWGKGAAGTQAKSARTLGDHYLAELKAAGLTVGETKGFLTSDFKSAVDTHVAGVGAAATGSTYAPIVTQVDQNGVWPYERPLVIADLLGSITLSGNANTVEYPVYGALEGGAGTVAEGGKKPQTHLPAPTWTSDSLKEVAEWWKVTDNMAEDLAYIVSEINNHARYKLQLLEETQLLSGDGRGTNVNGLLNRTGIQTMAQDTDSDPDRLFKAKTKVATATGFRADAIVINPADYENIRLGKDENGQYYGGGYFNGQYGQGGIMQDPPLWGVKTVVTDAIAEGTALVGAFKLGAAVIRKGGLRAESTNSHAEDFTSDLITFRIRERIGLQVKHPAAFVKVSLGKKA